MRYERRELEKFALDVNGKCGFERLSVGCQRPLLFLEQHVLNGSFLGESRFGGIRILLPEHERLGLCQLRWRERDGIAHHHARFEAEQFFGLH